MVVWIVMMMPSIMIVIGTNCDNNLVHDSCNESSYYFQNKKDHYIHNRFLQNNCSYREVDEIFLFCKNNHCNNRPHSVH